MKGIRFLALLLMVIGALNWGLIGFFKFDLVSAIFGGMMMTGARVVFGLVGLAGLCGICMLFRCCSCGCKCGPKCGPNCGCGPNCDGGANCNCRNKNNHDLPR